MRLSITLRNVQHISSGSISLDLSRNGLFCVVGKNGVGKTTIIKALMNLHSADAFSKTSPAGIFHNDSEIVYSYEDRNYQFRYDPVMGTLNSRDLVPRALREAVAVELPMPHGQRFNTFQQISSADNDIRTAVVFRDYYVPEGLISFLTFIYGAGKFEDLKAVDVGRNTFYFLPLKDDRYVREDHLSTGEFFLISLYRNIIKGRRLIVIDELDLGLDASAQVHLMQWLRGFCSDNNVNILFTTHSLAIMRKLEAGELIFIECENGETSARQVSYNFVKTAMYGFAGWDRYILTEDSMLEAFLRYLIDLYCSEGLYNTFHVIPVGGGEHVVHLLKRNFRQRFLTDPANVIAVLDGDQRGFRHARGDDVHCIPFESVEKKLYQDYMEMKFLPNYAREAGFKDAKDFYKQAKRDRVLTQQSALQYLHDNYQADFERFSRVIRAFLN